MWKKEKYTHEEKEEMEWRGDNCALKKIQKSNKQKKIKEIRD